MHRLLLRKTLLSILIVFVVGNITAAQPGPEQTWGLCIGIAEYDPDDLTLKWSDKDATEFSTFLRYGLGLPENHYRILRNREATREKILDHLGWLSMVANSGDRVYIFYSGHGKENSPFLPYDSYNLLSLQSIKKALNKIDAQDVIVFADACHSGKLVGKGTKAAVKRENLTGLSKGVVLEMGKARADLVIMTSAKGIQKAYELEGQKNSIFTYHLMKVLMDQNRHNIIDRDKNGKITLHEVYQDVYRVVTNESQQEPQISDPEKAKGIVLLSYSLPKLTSTPVPIFTPEPVFQISNIVIKDTKNTVIKPVSGIYFIKSGEVATISVDVSYPRNQSIKIEWTAGYGEISPIKEKIAAYTATQPGGDYVIITVLDKKTGKRLTEEPISINVVPK